jgi:hypothetical protein
MANFLEKNPDLLRRLKFYAFGFVLGLIGVSFIYEGRGCKMPGSIKLDELSHQKKIMSDTLLCLLKCNKMSADTLSEIVSSGKINYSKSDAQHKPYAFYFVEAKFNNQPLSFIIYDIDSVSNISLIEASAFVDTCHCVK